LGKGSGKRGPAGHCRFFLTGRLPGTGTLSAWRFVPVRPGMVNRAVFRHVKYDPDKYTGFAFGVGIERIAMLKYKIPDIRLFYAVILYRLDNRIEAERELNELRGTDISETTRKEVEFYLAKIKSKDKKTRFALSQSVGFGYSICAVYDVVNILTLAYGDYKFSPRIKLPQFPNNSS